jgi:hypothetical protein
LIESVEGQIKILDVGGTERFWDTMDLADARLEIVILNLDHRPVTTQNRRSMIGDGRDLRSIADQSFDVVFSNSVIEHVGSYADQRRMAEEVQRVGKRFFVQTPNRSFPIEPHFLFPFFQFLPVPWRVWLLTRFALGWSGRIPDREAAERTVRSVRLLSKSEFEALFPTANVWEERVLIWTKSFVAYDGWDSGTTPESH